MAKKQKDQYDMQTNTPNGTIYLPELLDMIQRENDDQKKVEYIQRYMKTGARFSRLFVLFAQSIYHPGLQYDLPLGTPEKANMRQFGIYDTAPNNLFNFLEYAQYFLKGHAGRIPNEQRRHQVFTQVLESLHADEAELLIMMKDKKLGKRWSKVTPDIIARAVTGVIPPAVVADYQAKVNAGNSQESQKKEEPKLVASTQKSSGAASTGSTKDQKAPAKRRGRPPKNKENGSSK